MSCRNGATKRWCEFRIFPLSNRREREKKGNGSHRLSNRSDCEEEEKRSEKTTGEKRWREDFSKNALLHREGEKSWRGTRNASFCLCKMKPFSYTFYVASTFGIKYRLLHV